MSVRDIVILGCSSQQPTRFRNHGAYLIRWNDEGLLFDPGEGTQRQFIYAEIAPPVVTRIFISHFHGDHCLGLGSMLMRLNLDKVTHPIHCYYPASGKKNFDRLRYGCIYRENINVVEHPVKQAGLVEDDGKFKIEAVFLEHGVENVGWRITEPDTIKFCPEELKRCGVMGPDVRKLELDKKIKINGQWIHLEEVSYVRPGDAIAYVVDTRPCPQAIEIARGAKVLICESTYLEADRDKAEEYLHMTAKQAAEVALAAGVKQLILTHFSARYRDPEELGNEAREIFPNTLVADDLKRFPFPR
ncbi:MAG: rnz [Parachlamydiales bacterium]|nr:rnz [Parachlamydiales bacterium]